MKKMTRKTKMQGLIWLAVVFTAVEIALPFFSDMIPRGVFAGLSGLFGAGAFATRLLAQKEVGDGS
jgi:hypothetical protein